MDPRMLAQAQFPFYPLLPLGTQQKPVTAVPNSIIGVGAPSTSPQMEQSSLNLAMATSTHHLGQQSPHFLQPKTTMMSSQQQAWTPQFGLNVQHPMDTSVGASSYMNSAYQTALLLARLNQQSNDHQSAMMRQMPLGNNGKLDAVVSMATAPTLPVVSGSPKVGNLKKRPSTPSLETEGSRNYAKQLKQASGSTSDSDESSSERECMKAVNLRGERRLVIAFESLGNRGEHPQTFGKSGALVPHGVCGTHTVYNERWRFEITHSKEMFTVEKMRCVCLTWKVTNLNTGMVTSLTESRDEAVIRNSQGQTISNKVFREALEARAKTLEQQLSGETNAKRISQLEAVIRGLRPKRFSEGPLIFGLQHKAVQDKMMETTIF